MRVDFGGGDHGYGAADAADRREDFGGGDHDRIGGLGEGGNGGEHAGRESEGEKYLPPDTPTTVIPDRGATQWSDDPGPRRPVRAPRVTNRSVSPGLLGPGSFAQEGASVRDDG